MKQILSVKINKKLSYTIEISDTDFSNLIKSLDEVTAGQKRLVVISRKVYKLYSEVLCLSPDEIFIMPDGEHEKNYKNYLKLIRRAQEVGLTRGDVIVAIGGGVVGDIAGFAASTYMRGIDFVQVPTTILAAVDSSVGGKTAIDLENAKNIVGTFYQPKKVLININFFKTLDKRQFMSGMGEVIKYSLIEESCKYSSPLYLFEFLTLGADKIIKKEPLTIIRMIEYCLNLKIAVVSKDEKEKGLRRILNLGHTYAHALETVTHYKKYTHGEAVVYGISFILNWAYKNGYISYSYYRLSMDMIQKFGFSPLKKKFKYSELIPIMMRDKKVQNDKITFIIPCDKKRVKEVKLSCEDVESMFI